MGRFFFYWQQVSENHSFHPFSDRNFPEVVQCCWSFRPLLRLKIGFFVNEFLSGLLLLNLWFY